jgi:hypothetical protein
LGWASRVSIVEKENKKPNPNSTKELSSLGIRALWFIFSPAGSCEKREDEVTCFLLHLGTKQNCFDSRQPSSSKWEAFIDVLKIQFISFSFFLDCFHGTPSR